MTPKLQSGHLCSLAEIFSHNRKIVIPDLQRDYCWGDPVHGEQKEELVSGFVQSLLGAYESFRALEGTKEAEAFELTLGMIYAYENPPGLIHLCDGQQRLTTLYLLIGMLNRKLDGQLTSYLISDHELKFDDREPYLQYAIWESTLYFLSDLVCQFFTGGEGKLIVKGSNKALTARIEAPWYFMEYDLDPTIQSMVSGLALIECKIGGLQEYAGFAAFLLQRVKLFYFDVVNRQRGEELYVLINTTGEPLTLTENIKPVLLGSVGDNNHFNHEWEERETFFWKNRRTGENQADDGMQSFFTWLLKAEEGQEGVAISRHLAKHLPVIHTYFQKLKILMHYLAEDKDGLSKLLSCIQPYTQDGSALSGLQVTKESLAYFRSYRPAQQHNVLVPLLCFMVHVSDDSRDVYQMARRLRKNYFDEQQESRKSKYVDWRYVLQIIKKTSGVQDVAGSKLQAVLTFTAMDLLEKIAQLPRRSWYTEDLELVDRLKENNRLEVETWEDDTDFMGDLSPLISLCVACEEVSFGSLQRHFLQYCFIRELCTREMELLRRIDFIRFKYHGYGHRGKSFKQDLYYTYKSMAILHTEPWFGQFFGEVYKQAYQDAGQYKTLLDQLVATVLFQAAGRAGSLIEQEALPTLADQPSIFYNIGIPTDNKVAVSFEWVRSIGQIYSQNRDEYYNLALLIALLVYAVSGEVNDNYIGVAFKEDPAQHGYGFDNLQGHYHSTAGNSYIKAFGPFSAPLTVDGLVALLNEHYGRDSAGAGSIRGYEVLKFMSIGW